jgi:GNAT superfamily N-acetyltransferase
MSSMRSPAIPSAAGQRSNWPRTCRAATVPSPSDWRSVRSSAQAVLEGEILNDNGDRVGLIRRSFWRNHDGYLVVDYDLLWLDAAARRRGFATVFYGELERYYRRSGVDVITIHATLEDGGYS